MDSITTTPVPASDLPINPGNRSVNRRLSARFPSSKDTPYPDDIVNEFGPRSLSTRSRTLNRDSSKFQKGSASLKFDPSMSIRRSGRSNNDDDEEEEEKKEEEEEESEDGEKEEEGKEEEEEGEEEEEEEAKEGEEEEEEPVRMSLMALLADDEGSSYMMGEDEDEDEDEGGADVIGGELNCCVCQVRHKGAAFVPCGHSFCRLCSRELWVEGANCPLCNNFILEILDIL